MTSSTNVDDTSNAFSRSPSLAAPSLALFHVFSRSDFNEIATTDPAYLASVTKPSLGVPATVANPDRDSSKSSSSSSRAASNHPRKTTDRTVGRPSGLTVAICR